MQSDARLFLSLVLIFQGECIIKGRNVVKGLNKDCSGIVRPETWCSAGLCFGTSVSGNFLIFCL